MTALHTDIANIPVAAQGCVVAIGNFDGVHRGHRALIRAAKEIAAAAGAPLGVITFEPHPRQYFQPGGEPFRLTLLPTKRRLLAALGVEHVFALPFDAALSSLAAEDFIAQILVQGLKVRHVIVGEGFAFGHKRGGHAATLQASGAFGVEIVTPVASPQGQVYSSTAARMLLKEGKFDRAAQILGYDWHIEAPVVHGDKRGRNLGFPTANQNVPDYVRIPYGVYAVRARLEGEDLWRDGVANFGIRPMFEIRQPIFETFIFDYAAEIYGKILCVQPVRHLRGEKAFADIAALVTQMKDDCIHAKDVLKFTQP